MIIDASASDNLISRSEKPVILIVDDSLVIRLALKKMLQKEYTLIEARNGEEAWSQLMDNESIQMVFSDLSLPELDGFGLLERIRNSEHEQINKIPFIAITDDEDDEEIFQRAHDCGATDLISKPFQSRDIKDRANTYTRHLMDSEVHSCSESPILDDKDESLDNLSSIDQMLTSKRREIIQTGIKTGNSNVTNLASSNGRQRNEEIQDIVPSDLEAEALRRIEESEKEDVVREEKLETEHSKAVLENKAEGIKEDNESCASKEVSEKSPYLARKIDGRARQQEVLELIQHENEIETVVAFDVQQRIHGNYRDDQGDKEETETIRVEIEKRLATEREQKLASCSSFTRFIVSILERINTLRWINLDNKIKNILKHRAR